MTQPEPYDDLLAKYEALLKSSSLLCKYLRDWELFKTSGYLNQARSYRRETEDLLKKEYEERKKRQGKLF